MLWVICLKLGKEHIHAVISKATNFHYGWPFRQACTV